MHIQTPNRDLEPGAHRIRVRRRQAAALAAGLRAADAPSPDSRDRTDGTREPGGVGGARILRRWSVADLIARADGAPRAMA
jgi:hypothetical protein